MRSWSSLLPLCATFALVSCAGGEPEKKPDDKKPAAASSCDVTMDSIAGTSWLYLNPDKGDKEDAQTRLRFRKDGDTILADYSASSISAMYVYSCTRSGGLLSCDEKDPHYKEWCRAWAAAHDGVCDPAQLAPVIGAKPEDLAEAAKTVNEEFKAAKGDELAQMKHDYNNPNNKVRGRIRVALNAGTCQLTIEDKFQSMFNGQISLLENRVGTAKFAETKDEYLFEDCTDVDAARPNVQGNFMAEKFPSGSYEFEAHLGADQKADPACTYTADVWKDWRPLQQGLAGTVDKGVVTWKLTTPVAGEGAHAVHFKRYADCGGQKKELGVTCTKLHIGS